MADQTRAFERLLKITLNTAERELSCDESGERVHRYVDFRVNGSGKMPAELQEVHQHLSVCRDCSEVIGAIIAAVRAEQSGNDVFSST